MSWSFSTGGNYNVGLVAVPVKLAAPSSTIKKLAGVLYSSIKKVCGIPIASVKKISGVA
jgi:hypothetical protein